MKKEHIIEILKALGISNYKVSKNDMYIQIPCMFAPYSSYHKKGVDKNPSGYIKISEESVSYMSCFTCDNKHSLKKGLQELYSKNGSQKIQTALSLADEYENHYKQDNFAEDVSIVYDFTICTKLLNVIDTFKYPFVNLYSVMQDTFSPSIFFEKKHAIVNYIIQRKYSNAEAEEIYENFGFLSDGKDGIYVLSDFLGHKVGYLEFRIYSSGKQKYTAYFESYKYLLNEICFLNQKYNSIEFLFVCEGLFDVTRLWLKNKFVVGTQGMIKEPQMDKILYFSKSIYYFTDIDKVGYMNVKKLAEYMISNFDKFGIKKLLVFNGFDIGEDPDYFFSKNDIRTYEFGKKFISYVDFLKKYKELFDNENNTIEVNNENLQS